MSNYLNTPICKISDTSFQSMISELSFCADLQFEPNQTFGFMLMAIGRENRKLTSQHSPFKGVLTIKVDKLVPGSVVHDVCRELVALNKTSIECFDGKTILTLIKHSYKLFCPRLNRQKRPSRNESSYQFATEMIMRRRKNGDL